MAKPLSNEWHLRTVAETSSKACYICHKPSTKVLITPDNADFFYVCASHLSDRGFASPLVDPAEEAAKRKQEELEREIEKVKQEYEEKQRKKKAKKKAKDEAKDKEKKPEDDEADEKERDEKIKSIKDGGKAGEKQDDMPRVYVLHRNFYQMRVERLRQIEVAKRNQQRMKDPSFFPAAPKSDLQ